MLVCAGGSKTRSGEIIRQEKYFQLGFIVALCGEQLPALVLTHTVCFKILSHDAMKFYKFAHHLNSKHRNFTNEPLANFEKIL